MNGWYLTNGKYIPLYFAVFKIMQSVIRVWSIRYTHLTEITQFFPNNIVGWIINFPSSGKPFCFFFFNWKGAENRSATRQNLILTRNAIFRKKKVKTIPLWLYFFNNYHISEGFFSMTHKRKAKILPRQVSWSFSY